MEDCLKRYLTPKERVHHINEKKNDNRIENLYLCENQSHHNRIHSQMSSVLAQAYDYGNPCTIQFNKEKGEYYIKELQEKEVIQIKITKRFGEAK